MTSILKKVLSIRNLSEAASPPDLEDEDTTVDDMEMESTLVEAGMESIPNFAEEGITNHTDILLE